MPDKILSKLRAEIMNLVVQKYMNIHKLLYNHAYMHIYVFLKVGLVKNYNLKGC